MSNNSHSFKLLDGYNIGTETDGYTFVTPWVDVWSFDLLNLNAVFAGDAIADGTLKLQMSNDREANGFDSVGLKYPVSAGSSSGDPDDLIDCPSAYEGTESASISAVGVYNLYQVHFTGRWLRAHFNKTGSPAGNTTVDIFFHRKQS